MTGIARLASSTSFTAIALKMFIASPPPAADCIGLAVSSRPFTPGESHDDHDDCATRRSPRPAGRNGGPAPPDSPPSGDRPHPAPHPADGAGSARWPRPEDAHRPEDDLG